MVKNNEELWQFSKINHSELTDNQQSLMFSHVGHPRSFTSYLKIDDKSFLRTIQSMKGWLGEWGEVFDQTMEHHVINYKTTFLRINKPKKL